MPSSSFPQQFSGVLLQFWPSGWPSVSQQLFVAAHELSACLHVRPGSRHAAPPGPHRPNWSVEWTLTHVSGWPDFGCGDPAQPQQSLST